LGNIIKDGVIMMVFLLLIISMYIFLSNPFEEMMTTFDNINGSTDSQVESGTNTNRLVFDIIFGALAVITVLWFIFRTMTREPDWGDR